MKRLGLLEIVCALVLGAASTTHAQQGGAQRASPPNIIVFLVDDLGYGDLGVNGHPTIRTPNLDGMAREGIRLTSFYGAPNCTPSRAMLLTGRYSLRSGLLSPTGPNHPSGIKDYEITLPETLKRRGYRTAMFGKWHLGDFEASPEFNPTRHGFDEFLGIPYSHDYNPPNGVPLFRGMQRVEQPVAYQTMTKRFTQEAVRFIRESAGRPFFIYLPHPMPHTPVGASPEFQGRSRAGRYGDSVEEVDWSVGEVFKTLKELGLDENTITVFVSDNGPWSQTGEQLYDRGARGTKIVGDVGWAGLFRGAKQSTQEGGVRVPAIIRWPGRVPPGQASAEMASMLDLFPTLAGLAGAEVPNDRPMDGYDLLPMLTGAGPSPRNEFLYVRGGTIDGIRERQWKYRFVPPPPVALAGGAPAPQGQAPSGTPTPGATLEPELFDLDMDPAERYNLAAKHPQIVERLRARTDMLRRSVVAATPGREAAP